MFYAIAVVLVLIADQALKYWVSLNIELNVGEQALIPGVIKLVNIHNSGAAFGLLSGGSWRWVFVVIAVVFTVVVIYALKRDLIHGKLGRWAAVGVLAGSIGNCIDRVAYGYVVDMFKFEFLGDSRLNAIFNVADVFISCCGVLFCLYIIFGGEKDADAEDEDEEPAKRRSGGSHSKKKPQPAKRQQRPEPRREPVQERTELVDLLLRESLLLGQGAEHQADAALIDPAEEVLRLVHGGVVAREHGAEHFYAVFRRA